LATRRTFAVLVFYFCSASTSFAQAPITYRLSFPEAQQHRMQVEATFPDLPSGTLEVVMSQTSPGRYAMHEFVASVSDVQFEDGSGTPLSYGQPAPSQWNVTHSGIVRVRYKVFGDRLDGTYLAIDARHAHINIPAALMWARGLESRAVRVAFAPPTGWKIATQLLPTSESGTYTAPNLQYLIDSPAELSAFTLRTFRVDQEFRIAVHQDGTETEAHSFASGVEKIVREARAVFGELPAFESPYTVIADFLPDAAVDGMEHRNSTVVTAPASLRDAAHLLQMLSATAHEFFHSWNVERLRPRSLEPFRLDAANPSGELWFAEGFSSYYEPLILQRAGLTSIKTFAARLTDIIDAVVRSPARTDLTPERASLMAGSIDRSPQSHSTIGTGYLSYYTWGAAIALALDLSLRARSDGSITLDDYMRRLWQDFGRLQPSAPGTVARPYDTNDLREALAAVSRDRGFAEEFFRRFIQGSQVAAYAPLLARAGLLLQTGQAGVNRHLYVVPAEETGRPLTAAERRFRGEWLGSKQ
jgi:predicted metalloprotease with PDZ domain